MLSDGEKMVWASAYASEYTRRIKNRPSSACGVGEEVQARGKQWAEEQACCAIESAWEAVHAMRSSRKRVVEGFGESTSDESWSDVTKMLEEMLWVKK